MNGMAAANAGTSRICGATWGMRKNMPTPAASSSTPQTTCRVFRGSAMPLNPPAGP